MRKTVLVTGSSSGIGHMTAAQFAAHGWNVAASARRPDTVSLSGPHLITPRLDVTDEASIASAVAATIARFGRIDVLVNNAGFGVFGPLEGIGDDALRREFDTNVFGAAAVIRHVLPVMRRQHNGTIVNVSSLAGRLTTPFMTAYSGSKFALEGMSESLQYELKPHGIRVRLIEPAHFRTGFVERALEWRSHDAYEPMVANMRGWVARGDRRAPSAEPVAEAIYAAATDRSNRLRYPVRGRLMLAVHAIMPAALWRRMLAVGMSRPAPSPGEVDEAGEA